MRKSLLSALYGVYVKEGVINLSSTLAELGIDDTNPALTQEEKGAHVSDLLKSRSGVYHPALGEIPAMQALRPNGEVISLGRSGITTIGTSMFSENLRKNDKNEHRASVRGANRRAIAVGGFSRSGSELWPRGRISASDSTLFG